MQKPTFENEVKLDEYDVTHVIQMIGTIDFPLIPIIFPWTVFGMLRSFSLQLSYTLLASYSPK